MVVVAVVARGIVNRPDSTAEPRRHERCSSGGGSRKASASGRSGRRWMHWAVVWARAGGAGWLLRCRTLSGCPCNQSIASRRPLPRLSLSPIIHHHHHHLHLHLHHRLHPNHLRPPRPSTHPPPSPPCTSGVAAGSPRRDPPAALTLHRIAPHRQPASRRLLHPPPPSLLALHAVMRQDLACPVPYMRNDQ